MFKNIEEVIQKNNEAGYHWFSKDTMRFFKTRLVACRPNGPVLCDNYFISSEKSWTEDRAYTLRKVNDDGTIDTVGEVMMYKTLYRARKALKDALKNG